MTAVYSGIAYLDLSGNRINWTDPKHHSKIRLEGSHFHDVVPMVTLVISCACALCFLVLLPSVAKYGKEAGAKPRKKTIATAVLCMILFFAFDIANRVEHERQLIVSPAYIAIDVPMGMFSSIADGILQIWLLKASPVNVEEGPRLARVTMIMAIVIYWIISFVCKGTQIWALVQQISPNVINSLANGDQKTAKGLTLGFEIYQDLNTAASGMMLLFAIGFAIFSFSFVLRRFGARSQTQSRRLAVAVGALAALFLARNIVLFTFTLLYSQFNHIAPAGIQLVYLAFYGILSAGVYICISQAIKSQSAEDSLTRLHGWGDVQSQSPGNGAGWDRGKPQANVTAAPYMYQSSYGSYRYEPMSPN